MCPVCSKLISRKADLPRHMRAHASDEAKEKLYVTACRSHVARTVANDALFGLLGCFIATLLAVVIRICKSPTSKLTSELSMSKRGRP